MFSSIYNVFFHYFEFLDFFFYFLFKFRDRFASWPHSKYDIENIALNVFLFHFFFFAVIIVVVIRQMLVILYILYISFSSAHFHLVGSLFLYLTISFSTYFSWSRFLFYILIFYFCCCFGDFFSFLILMTYPQNFGIFPFYPEIYYNYNTTFLLLVYNNENSFISIFFIYTFIL